MTDKLTSWVRPTVTVLWNGVPLEEYGVAGALVEATFTKTVGRGEATKKFKAGKPKVGGASIKFELSDDGIARRLLAMLATTVRPNITLAFGWEGHETYWTGGFDAGTPSKDFKKLYHTISFKADAPKFSYGSGVTSLTVSGVNDMLLTLSEKFKPRVFHNKAVIDILKEITDDNGITLDVDESANPALRVPIDFISPAGESDAAALTRISERAGLALVEPAFSPLSADAKGNKLPVTSGDLWAMSAGRQGVATPGSVDFIQYSTSAQKGPDWVARARNILRIAAMPHYKDLGNLEQARIPVLAWNVRGVKWEDGTVVIPVMSFEISTSGYRNAPAATAGEGKTKKKVGPAPIQVEETGPYGSDAPRVQHDLSQRPKVAVKAGLPGEGVPTKKAALSPTPSKYVISVTPLPEEIDDGKLTSSYLHMLAEANQLKSEITTQVVPGVPWLQAPMLAYVRGTHGHDGLYGIETSTITWNASGLRNNLTLKPATQTSDAAAPQKAAPPSSAPLEVEELAPYGSTEAPKFNDIGGRPKLPVVVTVFEDRTQVEEAVLPATEGAETGGVPQTDGISDLFGAP